MRMPHRFSLRGKVAVVTGASSGLGVPIALGLAEAGADIALGARRVEPMEDTAKAVVDRDRRCCVVATDVTRPSDCRALVQAAMEAYGRVDILVNNAGVAASVPASREEPEDFTAVHAVNLHGAYWMAQAAAAVMKPGASVINISSALALTSLGLPQAAYASSKAGLLGLTRDLAHQWSGRKGIRVNALVPGLFATEMTDSYAPEYVEDLLRRRVVLERPGDGAELAAAVVFLASDAASYITGVALPVDGGLLVT